MDILRQRQNRNYVFAAAGALVALLAFLLLPYATIHETSVTSGTSQYVDFTVNATALAQGATGISGIFTQSPFGQGQGALWLLPILSILALTCVALLLYRDKPFGSLVNAPAATQRQWGNYALIGIAALSILIQIIASINLNSQIQSYINANSSSSSTVTGSAAGHIGFWLYLLGMLVSGGIVVAMLVQASRQTRATQPAYGGVPQAHPWQTPPAQPTPPGAYPQQPYQSQPYQQPYPQSYSQPQYPPYPSYQTGDQQYQQPSQSSQPSQPPQSSPQWPSSDTSQPPYPQNY